MGYRRCHDCESGSFKKVKGGLGEAFHREAVVAEDVGLAAGDGVFVGDADDAEAATRRRLAASSAAQASPRPPWTLCSSAVMTARHSRPASSTASVSSGFTVCRLSTRHFSRRSASCAGGEQAVHDRFARADEGDIVAVAQSDGFAGLKFCLRQVQGRTSRPCRSGRRPAASLARGGRTASRVSKLSAGTMMVRL